MSVVQFYLSKVAGDAIDIDGLKFRARDRGIAHWMVETSTVKTRGRVRVTMGDQVAQLLEEELRAATESGKTQEIRQQCAGGLLELEAAMKLVSHTPEREKSDAERGLLGT